MRRIATVIGTAVLLTLGLLTAPARATEPTTLLTLVNKSGKSEQFRVDSSYVYHRWQTTVGGSYTGWRLLVATNPKVLPQVSGRRNDDGRLEILTHGRDHSDVYHIWQTAPDSGWSNWESLGGVISIAEPGVKTYQDSSNRIQIVVRGVDGNLHTRFQQQRNCCWSPDWQFVIS